MARYMVEHNYVRVIGHIWQPGMGVCAMEYPLDASEVSNIGEFTRQNVAAWLSTHSGDFQSVGDWTASIGDQDIAWEFEESECTYWDCMSPEED